MPQRISRDFISDENRQFPVKLGTVVASALSGFIAGAIITSIIWVSAAYYLQALTR